MARQEQRAFEIHNPSTNQEARGKPGGTAKDLDAGRKKIITTSMDDMIRGVGDIDLDDVNPDYRYISERDSIYCLPPMRMIALYDYDPAVSSPNVDSEVLSSFFFNCYFHYFYFYYFHYCYYCYGDLGV